MTSGTARLRKPNRRRRPLQLRPQKPLLEILEDRTLLNIDWLSFGHDNQHTGLSEVASQDLQAIHWRTPVDNTPAARFAHYGSPVVTANNTVIYPHKTTDVGDFVIEARNGTTGQLIYSLPTDWDPPPANWYPVIQPAIGPDNSLYFAGEGGKIYRWSNADSANGTLTTLLFYSGDPVANATTLFISGGITVDSAGNLFFPFRVTGPTDAGLSSGIARINASGFGTWVSATTAAGDGSIGQVPLNVVPALSLDESIVYIPVRSNTTSLYGRLLGLNSTTLATVHNSGVLKDPRSGGINNASIPNDSTASVLVGPDGRIFYGVLGSPFNGSRGWLLQYSADLTTQFTPGGFGWDTTPVIVPTSMVPTYSGPSSYLIFTKYNNYYFGSDLADGSNRIAVLDPNDTEVEFHPSSLGQLVMKRVLSILGPTPDWDFPTIPTAVREWCINTAAVDPFSQSVLVNSADGLFYRWHLPTNTLSQSIRLSSGIGQPYTPILVGVDGTVYGIQIGELFAMGITPQLTINDVSVTEGDSGTVSMVFTVTTNFVNSVTMTVDYATAPGTATDGFDYVGASGTLTFAPGEMTKTITVTIDSDLLNEADETFFLNLSNASQAAILDGQGVSTILDQDPLPNLAIDDVTANEGDAGTTAITFTVTLSTPSGQTVAVDYSTADGTATLADNDYQPSTGSVTLAPGETTQTITVLINGDAIAEPTENFFLDLFNPINALFTDNQGQATIINDDGIPSISITDASVTEGDSGSFDAVFTVTLSNSSFDDITVDYSTANGTATAGVDFASTSGTLTFAAGESTQTVSVSVSGDTLSEANETFFLNLSNPNNAFILDNQGQGTILDDDPLPTLSIGNVSVNEGFSGPTDAVFTVSLSTASGQVVTVNFSTADDTATVADNDYTAASGTVTFNPGETSQTITIAVTGDSSNEPNETFFVNLSGASGATITDSQGVGTIVNDDAIAFSVNDVTLVEGNVGTTNFVFTISLSSPSAVTTFVDYATADGTTDASDYTPVSGTATFNPGKVDQLVTVAVNRDLINEIDEIFFLNLSNPVNGSIADGQGQGTILNDDPLPSLSIADVNILELDVGFHIVMFTVSLSALSGQTVTVDFDTTNGTASSTTADRDYVDTLGTLTFAPGQITQTFDITIASDFVDELDETLFGNLFNAVNATIADAQAVCTIIDDDTSEIYVDDPSVLEGDSGTVELEFYIYLTFPSDRPVTVDFTVSDGTATSPFDYLAQAGTLTFSPGSILEEVHVDVEGDTIDELDETLIIDLFNATGGATFFDNQGIGTIIDDDTAVISIGDITVIEGTGGTTDAVFTVSLSNASDRIITVDFSTANGSATSPADYAGGGGQVSIAPGDLSQTVSISVNPDNVDELDELFNIDFSNPTSGAILGNAQATATIQDDDTSFITVNDVSVLEGDTGFVNAVFTISLSTASDRTVTVNYATADDTALDPADYIGASGIATLGPGSLSQTVTVQVRGDVVFEPDETFFFNLSNETGGAVMSDGQGLGTINDDDRSDVSVTLVSSANPSVFGEAVTFTATVAGLPPSTGTPTGTASFRNGATVLATVALDAAGEAVFITSALAVGTHSITVAYGGDPAFNSGTSAPLNQVVDKADTGTTVTSSASPSVFGQSVTFTATVTAVPPGAGTPSGSVTFLDGATTLGAATLNAAGQASFTLLSFSVGTHGITAVYSGSGNFNVSTSPVLNQVVNQAATTVALISSPNPTVFGQSVTFTATVTAVAPGAGTRSGTVTFSEGATTLGTGTVNAAGQATFSTTTLGVGSHSITATYNGDGNFSGSTSSALIQVVNLAATTTLLVSSVNPSGVGQPVTFTATVNVTAPGAGLPTGTVTFMDGATTLGTGTLDASRQATFTTSSLTLGSHNITAVYAGDGSFGGSTSATLIQSVTAAPSSVTVVSSANPSVAGQSVTFTATVISGTGIPTGTVTFRDGAFTLATRTLDAAGQAIYSTATLSVGTHSITVFYSGDGTSGSSTSPVLSQVVNRANTSVSLVSSRNPSTFGQLVRLTATASILPPGAAALTGTVTFRDGTTPLGTISLNSSGQAALNTTGIQGGTRSITATYNGNANLNSSTSPVLMQIVNAAGTTTVLTTTPNPSVFGQAVTLLATMTAVAPGSGTPSGTVTFMEGTAVLGVVVTDSDTRPRDPGRARLVLSNLSVGPHVIHAIYSGSGNFLGSTSPTLTHTVNKANTTTTLTSSPNPSNFPQLVTFTATVNVVAPGGGIPGGTVNFLEGTTVFGTGTLDSTGRATFATSTLAVGTHIITAAYGGSGNYNTSNSSNYTQTVNLAASTTTMVSSLNPSDYGQAVTFTATVTGSIPGTPTGSVTFRDGGTTLGSSTLDAASGQASLTTAALTGGAHSITAVYSGDVTFAGSTSAALSQVVIPVPTTTSLVSSLNPSTYGQAVTFTATVTTAIGSPTGTVSFVDGATLLGTDTLDAAGQATFTTAVLGSGSHSITAIYNGDPSHGSSASAPVDQIVNFAATITGLTALPPSSALGTPVTFTATVTIVAPGAGTVTGVVTFFDGAAVLGTSAVDASGQATLTTSSLTLGTHSLTASYSGDSNVTGSTSAPLSFTVTAFSSTTTVVSATNPSDYGEAVLFTATITGSGPGTPTGSVTFMDGAAALGTSPVNASGQATFTTSGLSAGSHSITAVYSGDGNFSGSVSPAFSQVVNLGTASTTVVSSVNPSDYGQAVTFTATVSPIAPGTSTPTGTVTFMDGTTTLGTGTLDASGEATFTTSTLASGSHSIAAVYDGDGNYVGSTSTALTQTVNTAGSTTSLSSSLNPSAFGQPVTFTATVTPVAPASGVPTGAVTFKNGLNAMGTGTLDAAGQATFTISTLIGGNHSITAVYNGDSNYSGSTSPILIQTVTGLATSTALASSANPSVTGQIVTFTATVTVQPPGSGTPTGTVTFFDGATPVGTAGLIGAGTATLNVSSLSTGPHSITAVYNGGPNFNGSTSNPLIQTVNPANTTTALASSINPSVLNQLVTFTATVTALVPGSGIPTGTVIFRDTFQGNTTDLGMGTLNALGRATLFTNTLALGIHHISAIYSGDSRYNGNTSPTLIQSVNRRPIRNLEPVVNLTLPYGPMDLASAAADSLPTAQLPKPGFGILSDTLIESPIDRISADRFFEMVFSKDAEPDRDLAWNPTSDKENWLEGIENWFKGIV